MKKRKTKNEISIPIMLPVAIIIGIVLIVCCGGSQLISNQAMYTKSNATTTDVSDFEYTSLENGTLEIKEYLGSEESIVIPAKKDGVAITSIGEAAFVAKKNIKSVQIPEGITNIGKKAFWKCSNLASINIPKGVTSIGAYAFSETSITRMRLPDSVTNIGEFAFQNCNYLYEINIPEGVTTIEPATFKYCAFESINIPDGVTNIGYDAFASCKNLTSIQLPEKLETIGSYAFMACDALTCVVIPNGVTFIDALAFNNCDNLSKLVIPDSVTKFGNSFYNNGTIYCRSNSAAEEYAKNNGAVYKIECVTDNKLPTITTVAVNPKQWTNQDVVITVGAEESESESGLWRKAYSFDGGKTWQAENSKAYSENTNGVIIAVKDNLTNIATYGEIINITNIDKEEPTIFSVTKSTEESTKESVTLTIDADDGISGLASYSFDGGTTWQSSNSKTYTWNVSGLTIKVKDKAGNITTYSENINITNIIELEEIKITSLPDKTQYNAYEDFDSTGMVVMEVYENGDEEETTDYTVNGRKNLLCHKTKIVIHSNKDSSLKAEFPISVGHAYKETVIDPTCTEQGYTTYKCEICFESNSQDYVDPLGHSYTNYVSDNNATCTTDGTKTAKCDRCDMKDTITDVGSAKGHTEVIDAAVKAICIETGLTEGKHCSTCKEVLVKQEVVNALGHSYTNYASDNNATCTTDGTKTAKCDRCDVKDTIADVGSAKGHTEVIDAAVKETCTETGLTEGKHCSTCKEVLAKQEVVNALGHNYEETVKEPTCTEKGYTTHKCSRCEDTYVDTYTNELEHNYENFKCTHCGKDAPRIKITTEIYEISEEYITKIQNKVTVKEFKENIVIENSSEMKILNKDNEELKDEDIIGTGETLVLKSELETKIFKLVVAGDVTGDGVANFKDMVAINMYRSNRKLLEGAYLMAGDVTGDEIVDFKDIVKINRFRLNKITEI